MRLERLHIQGFKSFKDRTTIHFDSGITGIVGPNGCGKSNIVDALFWVMGEQSAKHLRGTKMSDLIFSGSSKYSPCSFAEVTLVLNNHNSKHIHIGNKVVSPQEIQLTRKLYRNGETEYRINDTLARLKDIQEVFMDTGAGAKSYSIIAQGEIDRLVKARPHERRVMIEEVAGITKFKMRKKESLRKIEQTNINLERITDLKKEIYKGLKKLESQAEKAQKAKALKEKIKRNALAVNSHRELELLEKIFEYTDFLSTSEETIQNLRAERDNLEVSLENEKNEQLDLTENIESLQLDFNDDSKKLVVLEERLSANKRTIEEKKKDIEQKTLDINSLDEELKSRDQKIEEVTGELEALEQTPAGESLDDSDLEERVFLLKEELSELDSTHLENSKNRDQVAQEVSEVKAQIYQNNSQMEEQNRGLQSVTIEIDELEQYFNELTDDSETKKIQVAQLEEKIPFLEEQKFKLEKEVLEQKNKIQNTRSELIADEKKFAEVKARLESLEDLKFSSFEKKGSEHLIKKHEGSFLFQNIFTFPAQYQVAAESILSPFFDNVLGGDIQANIASGIEEESWGLLDLNPGDVTGNSIEGVKLSEIAQFQNITPELEQNLKNFLGKFFIVEGLELSSVKEFERNSYLALTNSNGNLVVRNFQGSITVDSINLDSKKKGAFERNSMIEDLKVSLVALEKSIEKNSTLIISLEESLNRINEQLKDHQLEYTRNKEELLVLKSTVTNEQTNFSVNNERLEKLKKRKKEISNLRLDLCEMEETLEDKRSELEVKLDEIKMEIANFDEEHQLKKEEYENLREELIEFKSMAKSSEFKKEQLTKRLQDFEEQKVRLVDRAQRSKLIIEESSLEITRIEESFSELQTEIEELTTELKEKEIELANQKDLLSELLISMQERDNQSKKILSEINRIDKSQAEKVIQLEKCYEDEELLTRNNFEEYQVDLREVMLKFLERPSPVDLRSLENIYYHETEDGIKKIIPEAYEFSRKFPGQLKEAKEKLKENKVLLNKLGTINWQAVEEYDRQKVRFDFLKEQEEELNSSISDLMVAIEKIDTKSKLRFQEAYDDVNGKFQKVFPIIFGGGNARLETYGNIDDEDFGIEIVASPPGKKMQNINLMSGGEKALTAVGLIFSIFLVKPSPFCLLDEVDAPLDDANVGRFNQLLREMSSESQFILITHNKKTMELNDRLYGITMQEAGVSKAVSVQLH
jgi:chromosome segregation protein